LTFLIELFFQVKNQIKCDDCVQNALVLKWKKEHEKTEGEKVIETNLDKIYNTKTIRNSVDNALNNLKYILFFISISFM
jgi:hypothetical protein